MISLKPKYFLSNCERWYSVDGENLHKIRYNGIKCSFDGYDFLNEQGDIIFSYRNASYERRRIMKIGNRFKLLSIVENNDIKNYLGRNLITGELTTFVEEQITFIK
jgi:hypothetical protein